MRLQFQYDELNYVNVIQMRREKKTEQKQKNLKTKISENIDT